MEEEIPWLKNRVQLHREESEEKFRQVLEQLDLCLRKSDFEEAKRATAIEVDKNLRDFADEVLIKKPEFQCFKMASENKVKEAHLALADLNQWREETKVELIDVIGSLRTKLDRSEVKRFESLVKILPTMEQFTSENKRLEDKMDGFRLTVDQALDTIVAYNQILRRQDEILCEKAQKHEMNQL